MAFFFDNFKIRNELLTRALSAVIMAGWSITSAWLGGVVFALTWVIISLLVGFEWVRMVRYAKSHLLGWYLIGAAYCISLVSSICLLRFSDKDGLFAVFFLFSIVWSADVCAYFTGRAVGGPKLAPMISPKKTWSGLGGGLLGALIAALIFLYCAGYSLSFVHALLAMVLALLSAMGDLLESYLKRVFGVKDSSHIIPGHGGFMDRLDGFIIAASAGALFGLSRGGFYGVGGGLLNWP